MTSTTVKSFAESLPHSAMLNNKIRRPKTSKDQKMFVKESVPITGTRFRIKKLYILYDPDRTFDDERHLGIAIQRGGMNVTRLPMEDLGPEFSDHMTGFAIFEEPFQKELRKAEGIEHYSYRWGEHPCRELKATLVAQYRAFAAKELGWRSQQTKKTSRTQRRADERARDKANQIAKVMGFGAGPKRTKVIKNGGRPKKPKPLQVQLHDLEFPHDKSERVEFDESIKKIGARVVNQSDQDTRVQLKIEIRSAERDELVFGKQYHVEPNFSSKRKSETGYCCSKTLTVEKTDFTKGHYKVTAQIALLTSFQVKNQGVITTFRKGQIMDTSSISFFVAVDPPRGGIWEDFRATDFSGYAYPQSASTSQWTEGSRPNTFILEYNVKHADHKKIKPTDEDAMARYHYRLTIPEMCLLDIHFVWETIFDKAVLKDPIQIAKKMKETVDKYTDSKYIDDV